MAGLWWWAVRGGGGAATTAGGARAVVAGVGVAVVVTCSYYNTGNYATIEDRTTDDKQINYKVDPPRIVISDIFDVRTKNVWWGNQGILGVGNRQPR